MLDVNLQFSLKFVRVAPDAKVHPIGAVVPVISCPLLNNVIREVAVPANIVDALVTLVVFHMFPFVVIFWLKNTAPKNIFEVVVTFCVFQLSGDDPGSCFLIVSIPVKIFEPYAVVSINVVSFVILCIELEYIIVDV